MSPRPSEPSITVGVLLRLSPELYADIKRLSEIEGVSVSRLIRDYLQAAVIMDKQIKALP